MVDNILPLMKKTFKVNERWASYYLTIVLLFIDAKQVQQILHVHLKLRKISVSWLPELLEPNQKLSCSDSGQQLKNIVKYEDNFLVLYNYS